VTVTAPLPFERRHTAFVFFAEGTPATDDEWFAALAADTLGTHGVVAMQRFRIADTKPLPGTNPQEFGDGIQFEVEGELANLIDFLEAKLGTNSARKITLLPYQPVSRLFDATPRAGDASQDDRNLMLIWSTRPEDPGEYDTWYDNVHIADFLAVPEVVRAQRFIPVEGACLPAADTPELGHLALYEVDGDLSPVRDEIKRQLMSGEMVLPAYMPPPFDALFLSPTSAYLTATEVGE